jgi:RimJ/RimL family protein N-acetyltransferase
MSDETELVVLASYLDPLTAQFARLRLEQHGVETFLADENVVDANPLLVVATGGVKVRVRATDVDRAKEILASAPDPAKLAASTRALDENPDDNVSEDPEDLLNEIVCPNCNSQDVNTRGVRKWLFVLIPGCVLSVMVAVSGDDGSVPAALVGLALGALTLILVARRARVCRSCGAKWPAWKDRRRELKDRVALRDINERDVAAFFEHQRDPDAIHMAAFTAQDPSDRDAFFGRWSRILSDETMTKRTILMNGDVAGHIVSFDGAGDKEVTYWLDRDHWGKGIATEALSRFLDHEPARPLYARVAEDHIASRRVLHKCGFKFHADERGYAHARGADIDEVVMILDDRGTDPTSER